MINFDCDKTDQPLSNLMSPFQITPPQFLGNYLENFQLFSATESRNLTNKEGGEGADGVLGSYVDGGWRLVTSAHGLCARAC